MFVYFCIILVVFTQFLVPGRDSDHPSARLRMRHRLLALLPVNLTRAEAAAAAMNGFATDVYDEYILRVYQ